MTRCLLAVCVLAACERAPERATAPPARDAAIVAKVEPVDAAPPIADAATLEPAPGPPKVAIFTEHDRERLDDVMLDTLPSLDKFEPIRGSGVGQPGEGKGTRRGTGSGSEAKLKLSSADGDFSGGLTREEIDRVVKSRKGVIQACYQRELKNTPKLAGKLVVRFKIAEDGKVTNASILADKSTLTNESVEGCVKRQFMGLKFPANGGALVVYPLLFSNG